MERTITENSATYAELFNEAFEPFKKYFDPKPLYISNEWAENFENPKYHAAVRIENAVRNANAEAFIVEKVAEQILNALNFDDEKFHEWFSVFFEDVWDYGCKLQNAQKFLFENFPSSRELLRDELEEWEEALSDKEECFAKPHWDVYEQARADFHENPFKVDKILAGVRERAKANRVYVDLLRARFTLSYRLLQSTRDGNDVSIRHAADVCHDADERFAQLVQAEGLTAGNIDFDKLKKAVDSLCSELGIIQGQPLYASEIMQSESGMSGVDAFSYLSIKNLDGMLGNFSFMQ